VRRTNGGGLTENDVRDIADKIERADERNSTSDMIHPFDTH
jgi:hypothetical protein